MEDPVRPDALDEPADRILRAQVHMEEASSPGMARRGRRSAPAVRENKSRRFRCAASGRSRRGCDEMAADKSGRAGDENFFHGHCQTLVVTISSFIFRLFRASNSRRSLNVCSSGISGLPAASATRTCSNPISRMGTSEGRSLAGIDLRP